MRPNHTSPAPPAREAGPENDPWRWLAAIGKLDKQGMAAICCWHWYEDKRELPFLKEIVCEVYRRFGVRISQSRASEGRRLFRRALFTREEGNGHGDGG